MTNLQRDALNRTLRTLWQGVGIDVTAAILIVLVTAMDDGDSWGALQWSLIAYSIVKTVLQSVLAWVMRLKLDGSAIPTPLPPADAGQPAEPDPVHERAIPDGLRVDPDGETYADSRDSDA